MNDQANSPSEAEQKKLWLDYLGKLNDRAGRADQATGLTIWVLMGLMGTLVYTAVPKLPLVSGPVRHRALGFLMLGIDCFWCMISVRFGFFEANLAKYSSLRSRSLLSRALGVPAAVLGVASYLSLSIVQFHIVHVDRFLPATTRACLATFAWLCLVISLFGVIAEVFRIHRERKYSIHLPALNRLSMPVGLTTVFTAVFAAGVLWCLLAGVKLATALNKSAMDWLTPLGAASYAFVFLFVAYELGARSIRRRTRESVFAEMEQQIIVEDLPPQEIKKRFVDHLIGPSLKQWLNDLSARISEENERRESFIKMAEDDLNAVRSANLPDKLRMMEIFKQSIGRR